MADERARDTRVAILADPKLRDYKVVGGLDTFANRSSWPNFFSRLVARLQWSPAAIDLTPDAREWQELPDERRGRLMTLLAGFCVAEDAVAEQLAPFADAAREATLVSQESLMAWVFFLQRRDEQRHALLFDRIAAEVLGLPGADAAERRAAARAHVPAAFLELFEERLPAMAAELAAGRTGLSEGISLYHMLLEGVVFDAGQHALLDDLADGALPGRARGHRARRARRALARRLRPALPDRDASPSTELLDDLLERAAEAAAVWGDAVPAATRDHSARKVAHRLHVAQLTETPAVGVAAQDANALRVEVPRAPSVAARGRAHTGDVGPGVTDHGQVLGAQGSGERDLQTRGMRVGHQRRERVGREPVQQPAAVLDGGVEQAGADARRARDARQQLGRERRVSHAPGVRVGRCHHHRARHVRDAVADRAQQIDRVVLGRDAPQADLHERRAAARRAQGGERRRAGQVGHVADRGADRQLGGHGRAHARDHRRGRRAQRALGRVLDVHDLGPRRGGGARLAGVHDAHEQLHDRSTRAPRLSNATSSTLPSPPTRSSMRRASSRPAASLPTTP